MTYSNDSLHIYLKPNNAIVSYPLTDIKNHTFNSVSSGINILGESNYFTVFPNPTDRFINIQCNLNNKKSKYVEFYDISGRQIFKSPNYQFNSDFFEVQFDFDSVIQNYKGLLFIKIFEENGQIEFSEKVSII